MRGRRSNWRCLPDVLAGLVGEERVERQYRHAVHAQVADVELGRIQIVRQDTEMAEFLLQVILLAEHVFLLVRRCLVIRLDLHEAHRVALAVLGRVIRQDRLDFS